MAQNDDAVLVAALGYVYTAPPGTPAPTPAALDDINLLDTSTWGTGLTAWKSVGHTSRDKLPEFGFDGGDPEVKGSWQKKKLREITKDDPIDSLMVTLHQFDKEALGLYYGPNQSTTPGVFGYKNQTTNERAGLVIIADDDVRIGHHFSKASVRRDDAIDLPIDDLAALPIKFTYLDFEDELLFSWISEDLFT